MSEQLSSARGQMIKAWTKLDPNIMHKDPAVARGAIIGAILDLAVGWDALGPDGAVGEPGVAPYPMERRPDDNPCHIYVPSSNGIRWLLERQTYGGGTFEARIVQWEAGFGDVSLGDGGQYGHCGEIKFHDRAIPGVIRALLTFVQEAPHPTPAALGGGEHNG